MLVILVGSLQAPFFVAAPTRSQTNNEWFLPNFQVAQDTSHDALLKSAQSFASALGLRPQLDILSVASFPGQEILALTRFDTTPMDFLNSIQGTFLARSPFQLSTWDTIRGTHAQIPCGAAFHLVASYADTLLKTVSRPIQDVSMKQSQAQRGDPLDLSDANGWTLISALIRQTELSIKAALAAVLPSDAHYEYLIGCASRVLADSRPQLNDIPAYLRRVGDPLVHRHASSLPFTNRSFPVHTRRLEPAKQRRTTSYRPTSYHDILMPDAIDAIHAWLNVEKSNMIAIAKYGPDVRRARNALKIYGFGEAVEKHDTLVIGQDQFLEPARGIIWDCRGFEHGHFAVPMDFNSPPNSDLNNDFILDSLASWPDQELVGFLVNGVQFRADLPLQILLGPHLSSLSAAWDSVESEILRLEDLGYYDIFSALPFLPMRSVPQGSTPRKYEPTRSRRISDGGFPRYLVHDKAGNAAVSLNAAIGLHSYQQDYSSSSSELADDDGDPSVTPSSAPTTHNPSSRRKWLAREIKPQVQDKVWDDYILRHAALTVFHEPINGWTDDVADYFNHIPLAPSEYWTSCFTWYFPTRSEYGIPKFQTSTPLIHMSFVSELRLGFGLSLSPNVAQRFSDAIIHVFKMKFDAQEEILFNNILDSNTGICVPYNHMDLRSVDAQGMSDVCRWIRERRRLTALTGYNQLRRYSVHMYTDDPIFTVIGQDAFLRAMRTWHEVTDSFNLRMAIPRKRQVGPCLTWLGFNFYLPAGLVTVAPLKVNRALAFAQGILQGAKVTFHQYRRFIGLLEHMLLFVDGDRTFMYGLYWDNFRRGLLHGPATPMYFGDFQRHALRRWVKTLMQHGGCYFSSALKSCTIPIPQLPDIPFRSSNIFGPSPRYTPVISLFSDAFATTMTGGLGGYAHGSFWHIPLSMDDMALMHITAWEFVAIGINVIIFGPIFEGYEVYLLADALASIQILTSNSAHSATLQILHDLLLSLPEFLRLKPNVFGSHVFGRVNVLADAASRAHFHVVTSICSQMGILARHLSVPARAFEFLDEARSCIRRAQQSDGGALLDSYPTERTQTQQELDRMHHLGQEFIGNEDQPLMFKFTPWGKLSLDQTLTLEIGKSQAPNSALAPDAASEQPSSSMPIFNQSATSRLLIAQTEFEQRKSRALQFGGSPHSRSHFTPTILPEYPLARLSRAQAAFDKEMARGFPSLKRLRTQEYPDAPHTVVMQPARPSDSPSGFCQRRAMSNPDGFLLPPVPKSHTSIQDILTGVCRPRPSLVDMYSILTTGDSDHALRPRDPKLLRAYADAAQHAMGQAAPRNTQGANRTGWKLWVDFLAELGGNTATLRKPAPSDQFREKILKVLFVLWCRTKCISSIPGRTTVKPSTILGHLYAVKRVHEANGLEFLTKGQTTQAISYLAKEYELVHGAESLIPHKREGFTPSMVKGLLQSVDGLKLPSRKAPIISRGSWLARNLKAAIALSAAAGFRRSEVSVDERSEFTARDMSRASLFFIIRGRIVRCPSVSDLQDMAEGDMVGVLACPTKNDPLGIYFMPFPIILAFHPHQVGDPGATLRDLALHCPIAAQDMRRTPLFTHTARGEPLGYHFLAMALSALLPAGVPAEQIPNYTWHSFRIGLACALRAAQAPDWV